MFKKLGLNNISNIRYFPRFLLDSSVSFFDKFESLIYIILIISPIDLVPDYLLGAGFIDDFLIFIVFLNRILSNLEHYKEEKSKHNSEQVINVHYTVKDDDKSDDDSSETEETTGE